MLARVIVAIVLLLLPGPALAQTEKRIALLIGNKDYRAGVGALTNPLNDIRIVGEALKSVGFEVLKPVENAQRSAMLIAIHAFAAKLKAAGPDAVGFLYYSGHGIASAGENYLIPTDVDEPSTVLLSVQGVKQSEVLGILRSEAPNAAHYLVLDACRHTLRGTRGGKGFVPVGQQSGVLVAFAAEPGKTASDIGQGSGPYAAALATELVKPGQSDLIMFHNVRVAVVEKTKGDQVPWTEDGIQRRQRVLFGGEAKAASSSPLRLSEAAEAWDRAKDKTSVPVMEAFIARYKDTFYADLARTRIEELKKQPPSAPKPDWPNTTSITQMLRCGPSLDRPACERDIMCSWADNRGQCQRKSGSLATVMLEAVPPSKPAFGGSCAGVEALVGIEQRCLKPKDSFKDCPECPEMVVVPSGRFMMGSPASEEGRWDENEGPQREVTIARPFAVGKFEVTIAEWGACVAAGVCTQKPIDGGRSPRRPVTDVWWHNITEEFLPWLSRKTGRTYRLLSDAEWEYAARAGTTTPFSTGRTITSGQANFSDTRQFGPMDVGSFQPNAFGLHDMHGNVWELVEDCSHDDRPPSGSWSLCSKPDVILRGGSWGNYLRFIRSAYRTKDLPNDTSTIGFRVSRTLP